MRCQQSLGRNVASEIRDSFAFCLQYVSFRRYQMAFDLDYLSFEGDDASRYRFDGLQQGAEYRLLERPQVERFMPILKQFSFTAFSHNDLVLIVT